MLLCQVRPAMEDGEEVVRAEGRRKWGRRGRDTTRDSASR